MSRRERLKALDLDRVLIVEAVHARLDQLKRFRDRRDAASVTAALRRLRDEASRGERHNLIPCLIDVVQAGVTLGEAVGVMREAYGHAWDPAGQLPSVL